MADTDITLPDAFACWPEPVQAAARRALRHANATLNLQHDLAADVAMETIWNAITAVHLAIADSSSMIEKDKP